MTRKTHLLLFLFIYTKNVLCQLAVGNIYMKIMNSYAHLSTKCVVLVEIEIRISTKYKMSYINLPENMVACQRLIPEIPNLRFSNSHLNIHLKNFVLSVNEIHTDFVVVFLLYIFLYFTYIYL